MSCKLVIGSGAALDWAVADWREAAPELEIRPVLLADAASDTALAALLDEFDGLAASGNASAFVVGDAQYLNFRRLELMGALKSRGFAMPPLICRGALVASSASVSENTSIGAGAIIGHDCKIGFNVVIGAGANLGSGSTIGNSAWIEDGVLVGRGATIGANVTLGSGVIIGARVAIGRYCVIDKPGKILADVAAKTFLHASHANPIVIVGQ